MLKVPPDSFNSYIFSYLRLLANKNTFYWHEEQYNLVWEITLINIFHFHILSGVECIIHILIPNSHIVLVPHQNSPLACPSPHFHGVIFWPLLHSLAVPPAQVHLTLLKSAEINCNLTGINAHTSSIFSITNTPALLHLSLRYSTHVINQILCRKSWHAALMALTQTCLIEFLLVTERLPTFGKEKR